MWGRAIAEKFRRAHLSPRRESANIQGMSLTLTCECGARFEVDEVWAGKEVPCPDCGAKIRAPSLETESTPVERPSWLALLAVTFVVLGAFTLVGTLVGAVLALIALIRRQPGAGIAWLSLLGGLALSLLTWALFTYPEQLPLGAWVRYQLLTAQVDTRGPEQIRSPDNAVQLTRPKKNWGRARTNRLADPAVGDLQLDGDLLLVRLSDRAYVDLRRIDGRGDQQLSSLGDLLMTELSGAGIQRPNDDLEDRRGRRNAAPIASAEQLRTGPLERDDEREGREWVYDVRRGSQHWRFLIRVYRQAGERQISRPLYLLRAYAPAARFAEREKEFQAILDSFQFVPVEPK